MSLHEDSTVTIVTEMPVAPSEEQAVADRMLSEAMEDGVISGQELELLVLEYVECIRRSGFEATLDEFNPINGQMTSTFWDPQQDSNDDPREDPDYVPGAEPVDVAEAACDGAYVAPALNWFHSANHRSEGEIQERVKEQEQAVLDCLSQAGFEFETFEDYIGDVLDLPPDIALPCSQAYNE